jgi:hypothetical protein
MNCGHSNSEKDQFCVKCGTKMSAQAETASTNTTTTTTTAEPVFIPGAPSSSAEPAVYMEKAKTIGLAYGQYVRRLFKKPTVISEQIDKSNFVNGIISLILFALTIPFIFYIGIKKATSGLFSGLYEPSFFSVVIKSIVFLSVLLLISTLVIYLYTRLCKSNASFKDVVARFGAFLTIPAALQLVALVAAIIQLTSFSVFLSAFGMLGLVAAICLTIYSYRKDQEQGIDALYGIMLTFLIMGLFCRMAGGEIVSSLVYAFISPFGS